MGDQIMVATDSGVNREASVMMNDPFKCEVVVEISGSCMTRLYEQVIYTSRKASPMTKSNYFNEMPADSISSTMPCTSSSFTTQQSKSRGPTK